MCSARLAEARAYDHATGGETSMTADKPLRYWQDMSWPEIAALDKQAAIAVLPVAAVEQHGPHLPLWVDAAINEGLLKLALDRVPDDMQVLALPMQAVGWSEEHIAFPGTLTLSADTLLAVLRDLGASVARAGFRRLVILNSHGGQPQILDIVARELRIRFGMFVTVCGWTKLGVPDGLFSPLERSTGIHGGALETSLMMHLRPDQLRLSRIDDFVPAHRDDSHRHLSATGRIPYAWTAQDLNPGGACGDARAASAEKGRILAEHLASQFVSLLHEVEKFDLARLQEAIDSSLVKRQ
ncbi:Creatinine amidohydrolase family protein [Granulibacter bethesdensis]|nr:Creatinine amidohydrolase family protein [Granulibacter bethesdensis]